MCVFPLHNIVHLRKKDFFKEKKSDIVMQDYM